MTAVHFGYSFQLTINRFLADYTSNAGAMQAFNQWLFYFIIKYKAAVTDSVMLFAVLSKASGSV
ncbi:MAG TPA: hypothetical protein PLP40_09860, partial [Trichococcus flocculiformis]|nr:hypothetical protein [Trichococcus flocculiformis]